MTEYTQAQKIYQTIFDFLHKDRGLEGAELVEDAGNLTSRIVESLGLN